MTTFSIFEDAEPAMPVNAATNIQSGTATVMSAQQTSQLTRVPLLPDDIRDKIIAFALPAYTDFDKNQDAEEIIPITQLKFFLRKHSYLFRIDRSSRAAVRQELANANNIGASISLGAPDDLRAVWLLGWDILATMLIDVHLTPDIQPVVLMAFIAKASNIKHLYLTTWTDATVSSLPPIWEDEDEVEDFLKNHGVRFVQAFKKLKTINIDLVCETDVSKVSGVLGHFVAEAWMGKKCKDDTFLLGLLKRALRHVRPRITVSAAQESKTFSNDPFC